MRCDFLSTSYDLIMGQGETGESSNEEYESSRATPDVEFYPQPVAEFQQRVLTAKYLGSRPVKKSSGIDVLNEAINNVLLDIELSKDALTSNATNESKSDTSLPNKNKVVNKDCRIRISLTSVLVETLTGESLVNVRVRFISFLGICRSSVKHCGFIVQTLNDQFEAHCFECEPNAGELCKVLESACQIRFEKCLEGNKDAIRSQNTAPKSLSKSLSLNAIISKIIGK